MRRDIIVNGQYYHAFNKSIAGYKIFNDESEYRRMLNIMDYYRFSNPSMCYSNFLKLSLSLQSEVLTELSSHNKLIEVVNYCLMPTHYHFSLKQLVDCGIVKYVSNISNAYSRYFNIRHDRKGPLWQSRFKNVLIDSDEQLLHLSRYIHLNATTSNLVSSPEEWPYSSYYEYINANSHKGICDFKDVLNIDQKIYKKFVINRTSYQRELHKIKKLMFD